TGVRDGALRPRDGGAVSWVLAGAVRRHGGGRGAGGRSFAATRGGRAAPSGVRGGRDWGAPSEGGIYSRVIRGAGREESRRNRLSARRDVSDLWRTQCEGRRARRSPARARRGAGRAGGDLSGAGR